jgi:ribonuclease HI
VFWGDGHPDNVSEALPSNERQTNNRAEYTAVMKAIEQGVTKEIPRMIIRTDSKLLTQSLNEWFVIFY